MLNMILLVSKNVLPLDRLLVVAAVVGLLASLVSFGFPNVPVGLLSFYFPFCWAIWIANLFTGPPNQKLRLLTLWLIIDVSILVMFLSVWSSIGSTGNGQGEELLWALSYFPAAFPTEFAIPYVLPPVDALSDRLQLVFGHAVGMRITDWAYFSIGAAVQSVILAVCARRGWLVVNQGARNEALAKTRNGNVAT